MRDVIVDWPSLSILPVSARMVSLARAGDEPLARSASAAWQRRRSPGDTRGAADQRGICRGQWGNIPGQGRSHCTQWPGFRAPQSPASFSVAGIRLCGEARGLPIPDDRPSPLLWIDRSAGGSCIRLERRLQRCSSSRLAPDPEAHPVIAELDRLLEPYGSVGAIERRDLAFQQVSGGRAQPAEGHVHDDSLYLLWASRHFCSMWRSAGWWRRSANRSPP